MKVPVEWLQQYISFKKDSIELAKAFTMVGLLLDKPIIQYKESKYETDVLDLEHRMDRSDWLSIMGCARDIAAYFDTELKYPQMLKEDFTHVPEKDKIDIKVDCPDLVNRFNTIVVKNVKVKESPDWLKNRLESYGIPSINNVVDITNYVMVELGQPMHAQDISKMRAKEIHIRRANKGEKITTFLGETMKLDEEMFVLTQAGVPTVIGGIVGGEETGVDFNTKDIVLDAGNYSQVNVRQTSRKLKIQNETVLRYDKLLNPHLTQTAIERAAYLIKELAGGEIYSNHDYISPNAKLELKTMTLTKARLNLLSGEDFDFSLAENILKNLEYQIVEQTPTELVVQVPYFRTDVDVEDDIVADVLRINGYDKIAPQQLTGVIPQEITPKIMKLEDKFRDSAVKAGLNEYITSPFVEKSAIADQIELVNTVNQGMNALRTTIEQTLRINLQTYTHNNIEIKGIFEIGTVFNKNGAKFVETRHFQAIMYPAKTAVETADKSKQVLSTVMRDLGYKYSVVKKGNEYEIIVEKAKIGKITHDSFYLDLAKLMDQKPQNLKIKEKVPNYKTRDITISAHSERIGEALYMLKNEYPNLLKIEVNSVYFNKANQTKTIGVSLYFAESVLDAEKAKNDILFKLNEEFEVAL
jgi:phenylalanyl-tRNA synthetase beta subunit